MGKKWIEKRTRGVFGWIFLLVFWAWQLFMVWGILAGSAETNCDRYTGAERDGCMTGAGLGIVFLMGVWAAGSVIFGLLAFMTRGKREMIEVETPIPVIDPVAMCKRSAAAIQQGDWLIKACLDQEQEAYDAMKTRWETLDEKTRKLCIRNATAIQQGYWLMHACIEQELEAKAAVDGFEFKR